MTVLKDLGMSTTAIGIYIGLSSGVDYLKGINHFRRMPIDRNVQEGYAKPSKLELSLNDLNQDGKNETLLKYDGKSYLLTLDDKGIPRIQPYEIKPAEVIQK